MSCIVWRFIAAAVAFIIVYWPWAFGHNTDANWHGIVAALAMAIAVAFIPLRQLPVLVCGATGAALLLCINVFHGSHCWWDCGFHFGTIHWPFMVMGLSSNLPGILYDRYGWPQNVDLWAFTLPAMGKHLPHIFAVHGWWPAVPMDVTSKQMCTTIYIITLLVCGIGAGLQFRRRDPRFLVAITAPWLMFFCFPAQIHERYLLFAAGVAAICVGQSVGVALLGFFLSIVTTIMTIHVMFRHGNADEFGLILSKQFPWLFSPQCGQTLVKYIDGTHPDIGWAVLLCAAIFIYFSLVPTPRRERKFEI